MFQELEARERRHGKNGRGSLQKSKTGSSKQSLRNHIFNEKKTF